MTMAKAKKELAELEKERARLVARVAELEQERGTAPASRLGPIASELAELRDTVRLVEDRMPGAREQVKHEQEAVKASKVVKLRPKEQQLWAEAEGIVLGPLRDTLEKLAVVHADLSGQGARAHFWLPDAWHAVRIARVRRCQRTGDYSDYPDS